MSGGSYDYASSATDLEDLMRYRRGLEDLAMRLAGLGYAKDAALETEELLVLLRQFEVRAEVRMKRLSGVWHAVEWWDSNDWSEEQVREALTAYRNGG